MFFSFVAIDWASNLWSKNNVYIYSLNTDINSFYKFHYIIRPVKLLFYSANRILNFGGLEDKLLTIITNEDDS